MTSSDPIFPVGQSRVTRRRGETVSIAERIDKAADQFEQAWQSGRTPRLEDFLVDFEEYEHPALLFELLRIEADYLVNQGETVSADAYVTRFPKHESAIRRAIAEVLGADSPTLSPSGLKTEHATENDKNRDAYITRTIQTPERPQGGGETAFTSSRYAEITHHDSGGLGDVFRGHDSDLGRHVAIKAIQKKLARNEAVLDQFDVEVKVTSRLDHPGIVPVYGMGQFADGRRFFVMRFIEGVNFRTAIKEFQSTDWKKRSKTSYRKELYRLLEHFCAACHTISYAHNRGIVHRDIKPQNIMLGRFHETLVVDWGLAVPVQRDERAKASGEKTVMPRMGTESGSTSGGTAGTLGYMSPEQFQDADAPLGPASDIYSLGATLYHLLTGSAPHQGSSLTETSKVIRTGDFPPPSRINKAVPKALEAVCLRAMALKPHDRYQNAEELAKDVTNWMTGEKVSVFKEPLVEQLLRIAQHNRNWTAVLGAACILLFSAAVLSSILMNQAANRENLMRKSADAMRDESLRQSAMFAAQTIEANIDRRMRTLANYAQDRRLPELIKACAKEQKGSPAFEALQNWLSLVYLEAQDSQEDTNWFITEATGRQLARHPPDVSIGSDYSHRDYFHGEGLDKQPNEHAGLKPISKPHLSNVYRSAVKGSGYRVAFSVPIFASGRPTPGEEPIAVLAMAVKTGAFQALRNAILVDLRDDLISKESKEPKRGLVLHHENLSGEYEKSSNLEPPRLSQERLAALIDAKNEILKAAGEGESGSSRILAKLLPEFADPLHPDEKYIAAFAPVMVRRDGPGHEPQIPWIVIVPQELDGAKPK